MDDIKVISSFSVNINTFRLLSVWCPEPHASKWSRCIYRMYTLLICGIFHPWFLMTQVGYIVKHWGNLEEMVTVLFFMLTLPTEYAKMYHLIFAPQKVRNLLDELQTLNLIKKDQQQYETSLNCMRAVKRNSAIFIMLCYSTIAIWGVSPVLDGSIANYGLPLKGWFPYRYDRSPQYEITYFYVTVGLLFSALMNSAFDTFVTGLMAHAGTLFDNLAYSLENIKVNEQINKQTEEMMSQVAECIQHHTDIARFIEHVECLFTYPIMVQFSSSGFNICITMFQLTLISVFSFEFISLTLYQACIIYELFLFCWFGNEIILKSEQLPIAIYNSDWYKCDSEKYRKTVLRFMLRLQKPCIIRAAYFFPLSLNTFMKILQSAWSYFALLRTMKDE